MFKHYLKHIGEILDWVGEWVVTIAMFILIGTAFADYLMGKPSDQELFNIMTLLTAGIVMGMKAKNGS